MNYPDFSSAATSNKNGLLLYLPPAVVLAYTLSMTLTKKKKQLMEEWIRRFMGIKPCPDGPAR